MNSDILWHLINDLFWPCIASLNLYMIDYVSCQLERDLMFSQSHNLYNHEVKLQRISHRNNPRKYLAQRHFSICNSRLTPPSLNPGDQADKQTNKQTFSGRSASLTWPTFIYMTACFCHVMVIDTTIVLEKHR